MGQVQGSKREGRQVWYAAALALWIAVLSVVGLSMSREQYAVRTELVSLQKAVHELASILDAVREAARLGCSRPEDYRGRLEARGLHAVLMTRRGTDESMEFTIPIGTGENAWLSISCPSAGAWLARARLSSGFEDLELRAHLRPIRRAR